MNPTNKRLWALTDLGAVNFLALRRIVAQQQAIINAMRSELIQVKRQLAIPGTQNTGLLPQ